ncbi:MAG: hypothetical protein QXM43_03250 [Desulfurococcaceae archaeon]
MFDSILKYVKDIKIMRVKEDEYTVTYMIYYLSEKIGIIEIRRDYAVFIEKIKSFLDLIR